METTETIEKEKTKQKNETMSTQKKSSNHLAFYFKQEELHMLWDILMQYYEMTQSSRTKYFLFNFTLQDFP